MLIKDLMKGEFACMTVMEHALSFPKKVKQFSMNVDNMSVDEISNCINYREMFFVIELSDGKSIVFASSMFDMPFLHLQKKYKDQASFYFMANDKMACFKILEAGKIKRKVSSFGFIRNGSVSCEEQTLGAPSEYELEHSKIYKMKSSTRSIDLSKQDIFDIIDFYIGFKNLDDSKIIKKQLYYVNLPDVDCYAFNTFDNADFKQALIHIGGDSECEYTIPFVVYEDNGWVRITTIKQRQKLDDLKIKKLLGLNIFNQNNSTKILSKNIYSSQLFCLSNFCHTIKIAVCEAHLDKQYFKDDIGKLLLRYGTDGEFIPATTNVFYLKSAFISEKLVLKLYQIMKNGRCQTEELVFEIDNLSGENLIRVYNKLCDKLFEENLTEKI